MFFIRASSVNCTMIRIKLTEAYRNKSFQHTYAAHHGLHQKILPHRLLRTECRSHIIMDSKILQHISICIIAKIPFRHNVFMPLISSTSCLNTFCPADCTLYLLRRFFKEGIRQGRKAVLFTLSALNINAIMPLNIINFRIPVMCNKYNPRFFGRDSDFLQNGVIITHVTSTNDTVFRKRNRHIDITQINRDFFSNSS